MDIYWSSNNINRLMLEPLTSLVKDIKQTDLFVGEEAKSYLKCPGYTNHLKNTFIFKSPYDLNLTYNVSDAGEVSIATDKEQQFFDDNVTIYQYSSVQQVIHLSWYLFFFSNDALQMSYTPAFFHKNGLADHYVVAGKYDISKWFRPVYPNIILNGDKLKIKKGDAIFYVKFHTDEKINFKQFNYTQSLDQLSKDCLGVKQYQKFTPLKKLYKLFTNARLKNTVMKEIKKNLIEENK